METALNLVWLGVSVALLLIGGAQVMRAGKDRSRGMAAVAMVCLICLLFPVISMTDDLNSGSLVLLEPSKVKKLLASAPLVAILLLPWLAVQRLGENKLFSWGRPPESRPAAQGIIAFHLSRRPPPPRLCS